MRVLYEIEHAMTRMNERVTAPGNSLQFPGSVKADINALETKIIKWIIGTVLTAGTLEFSIAKFVG